MGQRRMTSLDVIDTDAFLDMPATTQLLYFQLNARADDDGFVASPKKVMRSIGVNNDDLKLLAAKKFIIIFNDGVCVIKHWRINNFIRKDIYKETRYLDLKRTLFVRQNGAYTTTNDGRALPLPEGHFQLEKLDFPIVNVTSTERQPRLGKVSIGKDRIEHASPNGSALSKTPPLKEKQPELPFSWDQYLEGMYQNKDRAIQIIAAFFDVRGISFSSAKQVQVGIRRHLRAARQLSNFETDVVARAMEKAQRKHGDVDWTLETLIKLITK